MGQSHDEDLNDYSFLWETDPGAADYVLVRVGRTDDNPEGQILIVDRNERTGLVIEEAGVAERVIERMIAAGVPVFDSVEEARRRN